MCRVILLNPVFHLNHIVTNRTTFFGFNVTYYPVGSSIVLSNQQMSIQCVDYVVEVDGKQVKKELKDANI